MIDRVERMGLTISLHVCDSIADPEEPRMMLNNLEEAIKNYVQYDSILSDIQSLNICRVDSRTWELNAVIDVPKLNECKPGS